jgi:hypothetical protein
VNLTYRLEKLPAAETISLFLAGPSPRSPHVESWRPAAISLAEENLWNLSKITLITPEPRDGVYPKNYDDQIDWEFDARAAAAAILYWIPRDVVNLPGFTTNVEFGYDVATRPERVVLGCPPDCPDPEQNRYLIYMARHHNVPVRETLLRTLLTATAIAEIQSQSKR